MKEKIFINARIIDPSQRMDEKGSLILNEEITPKVIISLIAVIIGIYIVKKGSKIKLV